MASERSRDPPAVARSLPQPSIVTPSRPHFAAHSRFQGSLARPPSGETRPSWPQPFAQATMSGLHWYASVEPSQPIAYVVPILPHCSQITWIGSHSLDRSTGLTRLEISRTRSARAGASLTYGSIRPAAYSSLTQ